MCFLMRYMKNYRFYWESGLLSVALEIAEETKFEVSYVYRMEL